MSVHPLCGAAVTFQTLGFAVVAGEPLQLWRWHQRQVAPIVIQVVKPARATSAQLGSDSSDGGERQERSGVLWTLAG